MVLAVDPAQAAELCALLADLDVESFLVGEVAEAAGKPRVELV